MESHLRLSRRRAGGLLLGAAAALWSRAAAGAAPPDYETVGGYFFGQAGNGDGTGFPISDAEGAPVWTVFRALGGAETLGYPISRRFAWRGRATQVFQRGVLRHEPPAAVAPLNLLDLLSAAGLDPWLRSARAVPEPTAFREEGKSWSEIVAARRALLDPFPPLRDAYASPHDPIAVYGLPTSAVEDMGDHLAVRLQRGVLQLWTADRPWARAGEVTAALVGEIARDAGLFDADLGRAAAAAAFAPETAPPPRPAPPPQPTAPAVRRPPGVPPGARWIDVDLGRQRATALEGDALVLQAPVTTGKRGFATPTGTFAIVRRVANETMDSATVGIPRGSPEGYYLKDVLWTQYFAPGGIAIHTNYWQPASVFGAVPTSHGCVGMREPDARFMWTFAAIGTPVHVHP